MKRYIQLWALVTMVLALGFASCSKDEPDDVEKGKTKTLLLKIEKPAATTYAEDYKTPDGSEIGFGQGWVLFIDGDYNIAKAYRVGFYTDDETISHDDLLGAGAYIENLPWSVVGVFFTGAYDLGDLPESLYDLADLKSDFLHTSVMGEGELEYVQENKFTCEIDLVPLIARLEISDIQSTGNISSFTVDGIFMDHYYSQVSLSGQLDDADFVRNGANPKVFVYDTPAYPADNEDITYDWLTSGGSVDGVVVPQSYYNVWGYNVLTGYSSCEPPRIILRLSNIEIEGEDPIEGPKFLTITGFKDKGNNPIDYFEAGKVYYIEPGKLVFDETYLTDFPNPDISIDVEVTVTLPTWTVVDVEPEIFERD